MIGTSFRAFPWTTRAQTPQIQQSERVARAVTRTVRTNAKSQYPQRCIEALASNVIEHQRTPNRQLWGEAQAHSCLQVKAR